MPTLLTVNGYRFFIVMYDCRERRHVHVTKAGAVAKFWLEPVELSNNKGFRSHELREIERMIREYQAEW